eukprot:12902624-Alexandrium_andersonii.AAC.1
MAGGIRARVHMAIVGTAGLRMCSERLAYVRWGLNCTCRWPNCTCVRLQPRTSFPAPRML